MPSLRAPWYLSLAAAGFIGLQSCSDAGQLTTSALGDTLAITGVIGETAAANLSFERPAVDVVLLVSNRGTKPETLTVSSRGACEGGVVVRAWRAVTGTNILAWSSSAMPFIPCPAHVLPIVIAPQEAVPLTREIRNADILGDSLPPGNYTFTVGAEVDSPSLPAQVRTSAVFVGPKFIVPAGTVLDGTWSGQANGVRLTLALRWTPDSVSGTGTYLIVPPNTNRCGGGTLTASGTVTLAATRADDRVIGHMEFDNGWGPPYIAALTSATLLDGHFMSVDIGPCPIPLSRDPS